MSAFNTKDLKTEINTIASNEAEKSVEPLIVLSNNISKMSRSPSKKSKLAKKPDGKQCTQSSHSDLVPRPHTLDDFLLKEKLNEECDAGTTFTYNECSDDEEFFIVEIPKTINPLHLKGQTLQLGNKSSFKIGEDKYCTANRENKSSLTCIFNIESESNKYRAVNIKPSGTVSVRKKLPGISKNKVPCEKSETVPFPKNLKLRHPFFGVKFIDE
ncbi:uncharacterized protein LOC106640492 [Copidosoma floridanum]|uniref:uncharacterized protein LOC106640492 n=1 Tax=Copidosoma floridanum TaxID=29053 RepID=UPI0006C97B1F|nr:uncharacterized protein LOC106640492 [Copidosoma floridanum]